MKIPTPQRLAALPPYLFVDIDRKKQALRSAGVDVIDFGIGDPDLPTPGFIVDAMSSAIRESANHRYPANRGSSEFRNAVARFFQRRYNVTLDPDTEVLALIGSKEGIGHLPLALIEPGERVLMPSPGYPVYHSGTLFAGGVPVVMRLTAANAWLPRFSDLTAQDAARSVLMFLNYPNNPTGASAPQEFFPEALEFARRNNVIFAHDAAYNESYYGAQKPASILQQPGAKEIAIELHSLSKTFNMTGWRIGFAVGNREVLDRLAKVKANLDSSQFTAIQAAAAVALDRSDDPTMEQVRATYRTRRDVLCPALRELGFELTPPEATFYVWAGVPRGYDSFRVAAKLLDEAGIVCIPGEGFGQEGAGYVRFALTVDADRIAAAVQRMRGLAW